MGVIICTIICMIAFISCLDTMKKKILKNKLWRNIKFEFNNEFELIYQNLISCDLRDAQNEKNKNIFSRLIAFALCIWGSIVFFKYPSEITALIFGFFFILNIFAMKRYYSSKYKENVIKNFVYFFNPKINYSVSSSKKDFLLMYYKFSDNVSRTKNTLTDFMTYELSDGSSVILNKLKVITRAKNSVEEFNGIICEVTKGKNFTTDILIERNKFLKTQNRVIDDCIEFEKYFDVSSKDDIRLILTNSIKEKLISLYKSYDVMFEIRIQSNKIYIRFFTGKIFEPIIWGNLVNKKKLYKEYIIFKRIITIIEGISEIFDS